MTLKAELWLIRHGQTDWNLQGRYQGQADIPLNEVGLAQANALADELQEQSFDAIYSSDLQRARTTAEIVAGRLGMQVFLEKRLREIDQGQWEGQLVADVIQRYTSGGNGKNFDPAATRPPGGESVAEVASRVGAAADDITSAYPSGRVLIVSHGLAVATLLCRINQTPFSQVYSKIPPNAHPQVITWQVNSA